MEETEPSPQPPRLILDPGNFLPLLERNMQVPLGEDYLPGVLHGDVVRREEGQAIPTLALVSLVASLLVFLTSRAVDVLTQERPGCVL